MYRVLRRYKLSNGLIKYVSLPISQSNIDLIEKNTIIHNDKKLDNNLCRARTKIKDYILCNEFKYFITITCNNSFNRYSCDDLRRVVTNKIRYLRKKYHITGKYILIPEKHKNGAYHLHGVLDASFDSFCYINKNGYDSCFCFDNIGFNSIEEVNSIVKISSYITKYISKDFAIRGLGEHCYFCSRGLNKPILIDDLVYNNSYFDNLFFSIKNDFCYVNYGYKIPVDAFLR